ncbi:MAG TPA: hypothetical protein VFJ01_04240, partial [Oleiagrimonas sp.]|nr:hypothetical protein [Oleiagrimonas sp.]
MFFRRNGCMRCFAMVLALIAPVALAADVGQAPEVRHAQVPAPQDMAYPGAITLAVDASDTRQGIFRVH